MKKTGKIALGGMLSALSAAILWLGGMFPGYAIATAAAAGIVPAVAVVQSDRKTGLAVYGVVSLLGLLILPHKSAAIWYLVIFGYYGVVKSCLEQMTSRIVEWIAKIALYTVVFLLLKFVLQSAFASMTDLIPVGTVLLYGIGLACFVIYDIGFSRLIGLYLTRIYRKTGKGE